uniref:Putative secreted protein n=2 Tax=Rhipicephalus microplus TaxID=6941 RepID=A0A6M2CHC8_RHIMP
MNYAHLMQVPKLYLEKQNIMNDMRLPLLQVAMGAGSGGSCLWSLFWLVVLIILSVPVAGICAILYIIVSIFTPCIAPLKSFEDLLHKGVNFPHTCSQNMVHGSSL